MMYVRFRLSLRNVEDLFFERGIDLCHTTVRFWWNRFGPMLAGDIRRRRVTRMKGITQRYWLLDEIYVKANGEMGIVKPTRFWLVRDASLKKRCKNLVY